MEQIKNDIHDSNRFRLELIIIAIHSFLVGSLLLLFPQDLMRWFGLMDTSVSFYSMQSGVALYILAIVYLMIGLKFSQNQGLVLLALVAKFIGAVFLFTCYFVFNEAWILLVSSIIDFIMGLVISWHYIINISLDFSDIKFDLFDLEGNFFPEER